tara:strand:- start:178 stop:627 length:450 start_codon:yes stop_codon:yes gene_type:complete
MLIRTHVAIGVLAIILFLPVVESPIVFAVMVLVASVLPDIDTPFSGVGKFKITKLLQIFTRHRGMIHSLTFCLVVSLLLAMFIPILAFGFFLGFGLHLISDSFTKMGIQPFWPYPKKAHGVLVSGGMVERGLFIGFVIVDFLLVGVSLF